MTSTSLWSALLVWSRSSFTNRTSSERFSGVRIYCLTLSITGFSNLVLLMYEAGHEPAPFLFRVPQT